MNKGNRSDARFMALGVGTIWLALSACALQAADEVRGRDVQVSGVQVSDAPIIEVPTDQAPPEDPGFMDNARLDFLLKSLDPETSGRPGNWVVTFRDISAQVLTDERADRMRIMIPIADASDLEKDQLYRMLQANYESALDARYAIAQGLVWVAFIHPLSPLTEGELLLALAQTYNAAETYGSSFSGGLFQFGGGDNRSEIFDEILEKGTPL